MSERIGFWRHLSMSAKDFLRGMLRSIGEQLNWVSIWTMRTNVIHMIEQKAIQESYDFVSERIGDAILFEQGVELQRHIIRTVRPTGLICEFGVYNGASIRRFARALIKQRDTRTIYGFDSFEGLGENWGGQIGHPMGKYDAGRKLPRVPANVELIKGWIEDSFDSFLERTESQDFAFLHLDMDTYTPTKFVLERVKSRCPAGTILLFDELYGYPNWENHEYKALTEVFDSNEYEFVGFSTKQCAIKIK